MKVFYKKDFMEVLKKYTNLKKEFDQYKVSASNNINVLEEKSFSLLEENSKLKDTQLKNDVFNQSLKEELNNYKMEVAAVRDELKKVNNANGGYKKSNNEYKKVNEELKKQVSELVIQVEDLKSNRYLIKKIPSGRTKSTIKTKISMPMRESVRRFMKENFD